MLPGALWINLVLSNATEFWDKAIAVFLPVMFHRVLFYLWQRFPCFEGFIYECCHVLAGNMRQHKGKSTLCFVFIWFIIHVISKTTHFSFCHGLRSWFIRAHGALFVYLPPTISYLYYINLSDRSPFWTRNAKAVLDENEKKKVTRGVNLGRCRPHVEQRC